MHSYKTTKIMQFQANKGLFRQENAHIYSIMRPSRTSCAHSADILPEYGGQTLSAVYSGVCMESGGAIWQFVHRQTAQINMKTKISRQCPSPYYIEKEVKWEALMGMRWLPVVCPAQMR